MTAISVRSLSKTFRTFERREGVLGGFRDLFWREYRAVRAVDEISFDVQPGELIGYIGPNGAGKSTSIKMLTGILKPTGGEMSVLGYHPFYQREEYTRHIGVVFGQRTQLWWDIAVIESLKLLGSIYEVERAEFKRRLDALTGILSLEEVFHTPVRKLSLGQRVRSDLAASLIHNPRVLFLDEPTIGLDAVAKDGVRTFLREINRAFQTTIILTTHDLKEIEELCQRIIIIDHGKIIFDGSLTAIKSLPGLERRIVIDFRRTAPTHELEQLFGDRVRFALEGERRVTASFDQQQVATVELMKNILDRYDVLDVTIHEPDIEAVVMKIYREGLAAVAIEEELPA